MDDKTMAHDHPGEHVVPTSDAEVIQYVGLGDLPEEARFDIEQICKDYHKKIKRKIKNEASMVVHVKCHGDVDGESSKRLKYSVHLRLKAATRHLESEAFDFDIRAAGHRAYEALLSEIEHRFHDEGGVASKLYDRQPRK